MSSGNLQEVIASIPGQQLSHVIPLRCHDIDRKGRPLSFGNYVVFCSFFPRSVASGASLLSDCDHDDNDQKCYKKNGPPIMAHNFPPETNFLSHVKVAKVDPAVKAEA